MKNLTKKLIAALPNAALMTLIVAGVVSMMSCVVSSTPSEPRVSKPLVTDLNEVHWRMYYEDQFDAYGKAVPPSAGAPDVAWKAYYSEKNAFAIRENNRLLKEQMRRQKKKDKEKKD